MRIFADPNDQETWEQIHAANPHILTEPPARGDWEGYACKLCGELVSLYVQGETWYFYARELMPQDLAWNPDPAPPEHECLALLTLRAAGKTP